MIDRLDRTKRNGQTLIEKSRDEEEKKLIQGTLDSLTEQLGLIKSWMDEKKTLVSSSFLVTLIFLVFI